LSSFDDRAALGGRAVALWADAHIARTLDDELASTCVGCAAPLSAAARVLLAAVRAVCDVHGAEWRIARWCCGRYCRPAQYRQHSQVPNHGKRIHLGHST
jgi:hypothetical protein